MKKIIIFIIFFLLTGFWFRQNVFASWSTLASAPAGIGNGASFACVDDTIYALKGGVSNNFWAYSISANTWFVKANTPANVDEGGALVYPGSGDTIYALAGNNSNFFWAYSISNDSWTSLAATPLNVMRGGSLTSVGADTIFAFMGDNSNTFWKYSISANTWTSNTAIPIATNYGSTLIYPGFGDTVYALGGSAGSGNTFWAYSISNDTWISQAPTPAAVGYGACIVYAGDGIIYAFRGANTNNFWAYNINTNIWDTKETTPENVAYGGALAYTGTGDTIYAFAGNSSNFWAYKKLTYYGPNWYVNAATGSDTNNGSETYPFATITRALQSAVAYDTIYIAAGTYSETVEIDTDGISLIGADSTSTILDINDSSLVGNKKSIYADNQIGLLLKNLQIRNYYYGISWNNIDSSQIENVWVRNCGEDGIYLYNNSDNNILVNNISSANEYNGIYLSSANNNILTNNTTLENVQNGISIYNGIDNILTNNMSLRNIADGIYISSSSNNIIENNTVYENLQNGILFSSSSDNNTITNNISSNNNYGFYIVDSSNNYFSQNTTDSNHMYGVYIAGSSSIADTFVKNNIKTSPINPDSGVWNLTTNYFDFSRNYWHTTDSSAIAVKIKNTGGGAIIWSPYLLGIVDTGLNADTIAPAAPSIYNVDTSVSGQITLYWTKPTLDENGNALGLGDTHLAGYRLYRYNQPDTNNWESYLVKNILSPNDTSFIDTDIVMGETYYYRVAAFDTHITNSKLFYNISWYSNAAQAIAPAVPYYGPNWYVNAATGNDTNNGSVTYPFATITRALQSAAAYDTIYIAAGTYSETVVIDIDGISLIGADSSATIIDAGDSNTANTAVIVVSKAIGGLIKDLTIRDGFDGIYYSDTSSGMIIENCNILSNKRYGFNRAGSGYPLLLQDNNFSNNDSYAIYSFTANNAIEKLINNSGENNGVDGILIIGERVGSWDVNDTFVLKYNQLPYYVQGDIDVYDAGGGGGSC